MSIMSSASGASLWRGYEYYKAKKVKSFKKLSDDEYEGVVSGSRKEPYLVKINTAHIRQSKCNCHHAEPNESIYDSAIREIKEETGLDIKNLKPCGFMYWFNNKTEDKYFTYFYKTTDYSGTLIDSTDEGKVFWASFDELDSMKLAPNFKEYLPMFLEDKYSEAYCSWNEDMQADIDKTSDNPWGIIYR